MSEKPKQLGVELKRVSRLIDEANRRINSDALSRGVFYSGVPITSKINDLMQLMEGELKSAISKYPTANDQKIINLFIDEQKSKIYEAAIIHGLKVPKIGPLETRVDELKGLIENRRNQVRSKSRRELIRFWVPVVISIAALIISLVRM